MKEIEKGAWYDFSVALYDAGCWALPLSKLLEIARTYPGLAPYEAIQAQDLVKMLIGHLSDLWESGSLGIRLWCNSQGHGVFLVIDTIDAVDTKRKKLPNVEVTDDCRLIFSRSEGPVLFYLTLYEYQEE